MNELPITKEQFAKEILFKKPNNINLNIDGADVNLNELEKIFFLSKINSDPAFIASILKLPVKRVDKIVNSLNFEQIVSEYMNEFIFNEAGEQVEQLTLRYADFLKECFNAIRVSVGMKIRDHIEQDKPVKAKDLSIPLIEKLMKLEFALRGLPIEIKGILHKDLKGSKDKSDKELIESINSINQTIKNVKGGFNPSAFVTRDSEKIIDIEDCEEDLEEDSEKDIKDIKENVG